MIATPIYNEMVQKFGNPNKRRNQRSFKVTTEEVTLARALKAKAKQRKAGRK